MGAPKVLLLDEPSLGLAPILTRAIFQSVREVNAAGVTVILVEQNARAALKLASRGYVLEVGHIALADSASALLQNPDVQAAYLGNGE
jgi:branched-chain amino acid transport system ATP-binding protein